MTSRCCRRPRRPARFDYDGEPGGRGLAAPRARRRGLAEDYVATEDAETLVGATIETRDRGVGRRHRRDPRHLGPGFVFIGSFEPSVFVGPPRAHDR